MAGQAAPPAVVPHPLSAGPEWRTEIMEVAARTQRKEYRTITAFENAVQNIIRAQPHAVDRVALREAFRRGMADLRSGFDSKSRHFFSSPEGIRLKMERALRPTQATLVVVPMALLEHWFEQFSRHVDPKKLTPEAMHRGDGAGSIWFDGWGDLTCVKQPLTEPKLDNTRPTLSAEEMAGHMVIVTTFERCALEYDHQDYQRSPYKQLRWLRLIVDEGHELGGGRHAATDDDHKFISEIAAERRWVMTGTPTVGTEPRHQLEQLQNLMKFLRHPRFLHDPTVWEDTVERPYLRGGEGATQSVLEILSPLMVRHTKPHLRLKDPRFTEHRSVLPRAPRGKGEGGSESEEERVEVCGGLGASGGVHVQRGHHCAMAARRRSR